MDAIEKRARERLDTELRKLGLHEDAYHVGCGADLDRNDQAAINAIAAALTPPEGYVLVPVEPTVELLLAMSKALGIEPLRSSDEGGGCPITGSASTVRQCYDALLAARPEVP